MIWNPGQTLAKSIPDLPNNDWKKIYINLVTEVSAYPSATDYKIFIATLNTSSTTKELWIDNLKLIY